jgi:hypothetical protein
MGFNEGETDLTSRIWQDIARYRENGESGVIRRLRIGQTRVGGRPQHHGFGSAWPVRGNITCQNHPSIRQRTFDLQLVAHPTATWQFHNRYYDARSIRHRLDKVEATAG